MSPIIQNLITACEWSTSNFLVISDNVFSPLLYYSYLGSVIPSVIIALFVFFKGPKKLTNRLLLLMVLSFTAWVFFALVTWATEYPSYTMFAWSLLILFEPLVYFFAFYFVYVFIYEKDFSTVQKILFSLPLLITFILTPTKFGLLGYDISNCDRAAIEGIVATYGYAIELVYMFLILSFSFYFINRNKDFVLRKKAILLTAGTILFLLSFSAGNILEVFTENWYIGQYGLFGAPIFVGFLAYMIVKFKSFNIKLIGTQVLVFALGFLVLAILFIRNITDVRIVVGFTLAFVIGLGYALIKSVKKEVEQKEELAKLNIDLEDLLKQRESLVHLVTHKVKGSFTRSKYIFAGMLDGTFGEVTPELKKYAEQGLESDNMGIETVDLVLSVANMQKGTVKYEMKNTDLKDLVEKTVFEKKIAAEAKGLKLETEIAPDTYNVLGDAFWLKEAVNNLIENSIKYTKEGKITVDLAKKENKILLSVKDTGVGITPEDKKGLFTEGGRGKDSVKINVDSTGYGLYSVKLIVEAHKGKVWAESEGVGKGSTFWVELEAV